MITNKVKCADRADVNQVASMCGKEGYFVSIEGLMVSFWR